jgi:hypothetical protein
VKPGQSALASRLTEQVMRDLKVRMAASEFTENASKSSSKSSSHSWEQPLLEDVMFVDNSRGADSNPGTYEAPKLTIQNGVNNAFGNLNVYVDKGNANYEENVVMPDNVKLYGSGTQIHGISGKYFGTDLPPVVEGESGDPTFTIGNNTTLAGFEIRNAGATAHETSSMGYGVYGPGIQSALLKDLTIIGTPEEGILLRGVAGQDFSATLQNVTVENSGGWGAVVEAGEIPTGGIELGGTCNITVSDSTFDNNAAGGLLIAAVGFDDIAVTLSDIEANGNGGRKKLGARGGVHSVNSLAYYCYGNGVLVDVLAASGDATITASRLEASDNHGEGLTLIAMTGMIGYGITTPSYTAPHSGGDATITVEDAIADNNGGSGVGIWALAIGDDSPTAIVRLSDVEACGNGTGYSGASYFGKEHYGNGIEVLAIAGSTPAVAFVQTGTSVVDIHGVRASNNWGDGVVVDALAGDQASVTIHDVEANYNGYESGGYSYGDGVFVRARCTEGETSVALSDITANYNAESGITVIGGDAVHMKGSGASGAAFYGEVTVTVTDSVMTHNGYYGLNLNARESSGFASSGEADVTVSGCSLHDNDEFDLSNEGDDVIAINNWWGQNGNPYLNGQIGGANADGVTYAPWLTVAP